ncbi:MAG: 3-hydroxybutyryl-CoA dehydrogenase [Solirubrobacterales bacterium]|jgi:3-hydroxybutyryl-CoA dehydrogenase|nr:3-hydroxybutyryl-CoA dehydrogenase [Solirubrobacterales bacterium]
MGGPDGYSRPGIAGSGAIACGLAACASRTGTVRLLARSDASAWRAEESAQTEAKKVEGAAPDRIRVTTDAADLAECDVIVEAIIEDAEAKAELLARLAAAAAGADLATTTSSLPIGELADAAGVGDRFYGLHVFNPVTRMELIELCLPDGLRDGVRERALEWCRAMDKTAVEVPDQVGFVVNRLLFPYLFEAVRMKEATGMSAEDVDACMQLGAGHPMGPLKLLDFVGLDVAAAIGESLERDGAGGGGDHVPDLVREMVGEGKLGRKSGEGFFEY